MSAKQIVQQEQKAYMEVFNKSGGTATGDLMQFYTSDVRYMAPGIPTVCGQANLKAAFDKYAKNTGLSGNSKMHIGLEDAQEAGNFIIATGNYKVTSDGKDVDVGKYVTAFKQEGGKWRAFYDIFCNN